ncbi:hypothetical protein [Sulfurivirga sp.]|uniref:hypothetical protein n=1 Tax=Sulfurivirga sp. TaxID=2614236 RepID=UPI0025DBF074|nr:hypothetical protein [Sulfurivirga sp.]
MSLMPMNNQKDDKWKELEASWQKGWERFSRDSRPTQAIFFATATFGLMTIMMGGRFPGMLGFATIFFALMAWIWLKMRKEAWRAGEQVYETELNQKPSHGVMVAYHLYVIAVMALAISIVAMIVGYIGGWLGIEVASWLAEQLGISESL